MTAKTNPAMIHGDKSIRDMGNWPGRLWLVVALALTLGACAGRSQPMGPPVQSPAIIGDSVIAGDGYVLPLRSWLPEGEVRAAIVALHGFNDYAHAFSMPAPVWAEAGIATYAYDQRGFGATDQIGIWPGTDTLVADAGTVVDLVRARHPGVPVYLLGESMGGAVVLAGLGRPAGEEATTDPIEVDGVILVAAAVWARGTMPFYQRLPLWLGSNLVPWMTLTGRGLDIQPSDNIDMLIAFSRDPLVIKETRIDTIDGLTDLMSDALDAAPALSAPALILYGDHDDIIPPPPIEAMLRRLPADRHVVAFYADGFHMLLRDLNGDIPQGDIAHWIADPDAPLPSGADLRGAERRMMLAEQATE